MNRRHLILSALSLAPLALGALSRPAQAESFAFTLSDAEWRARLSADAYAVLRQEDTEPPFSSPLNTEKRAGVYHCAGCDQALFDAAAKFDSGTGWPSFWQELPGAVGYREDRTLFLMLRTEEHCSNCGGHLGHVFDDGPAPTGKRHCINGLALAFRPAV